MTIMPEVIAIQEAHPQRITVQQALAKYQEHCRQPVPFLTLVKDMINDKSKTEFNNDSYFDALFLTELMFEKAEKQVCILTGSSFDHFLTALKEPFLKMLERVQKAHGSVKVVLLNCKSKSVLLESLAEKFSDTLLVRYASAAKPVGHFTVCDASVLRSEEIHGEITDASFADEIKAKVSFSDPVRGKSLEGFFGQLWGKLN